MLVAIAGLSLAAVALAEAAPVPPPRAPTPPADCRETLRDGGVKLSGWPLRPSQMPNGVLCEAPDGVAVRRGPVLRYQPAARVNCAFAQRLIQFERIVDEEARAVLRSRVRAIVQLGTYNCRRMAAYPDLVSEHSFANAIDVAAFLLADGRRVDVERDWVPANHPAPRPASQFLRRLTRRLFDEKVFSVVLTPSYDKHHKNHLHLDGAAYTVDGT
ncbi:MAG TPA: extensin family protein [Polyangia bacterium]|nr:extensin family protein [Polyangia bacterium]